MVDFNVFYAASTNSQIVAVLFQLALEEWKKKSSKI